MKFIVYEKNAGDRQDLLERRAARRRPARRRRHPDRRAHPLRHPRQDLRGEGGICIRDLNSLNGTKVNGRRVVEAPLVAGDRIKIGRASILVFGSPSAGPFDDSTSELIAGTVETDRPSSAQTVKIHLDQLRKDRIAEDDRILLLRNLFETLQSAVDREDVLDKVRHVLRRAFHRSRVFVVRRDVEEGWRAGGPEDEERRPSLTFAAEAAHTSSAVLSTSITEDRRFSGSESARISGIETAIAAPVACDGSPVAVLYVDRLGTPPFSRRDLNILGVAANHTSAVLDGVSRFGALKRTNEELVEARERLAELNRDLEQLVEERTAEIRRQADEIRRLAEAKDELLGIAAHDIRGPLTVIQGTSELLRIRVGRMSEKTLTHSLDLLHGASRGLSQLLSELLDAKAIESGKIHLRKRWAPVRRLLADALPAARLAAEDKRIDLRVETDDGLEVCADPQRLGQAITDLALNAVKFSDSGTRIVLRGVSAPEGETRIEVEDQGVGISEEELEGIFATFSQGEAGRVAGGSGLGLMIARRLVELHGGTLSVRSRVGVGTRFTLSLPADPCVPHRVEVA